MKTALDSVKDLEVQVRQWQGRLDIAKAENDRLVKHNAILKQDAENLHGVIQQDAQNKLTEVKVAQHQLGEAKAALEGQRREFEAALVAFKQEKNAFGRERQTALDMKANYEKMFQKVAEFIRLVRSSAEGL